jgi:type III secretory pathway component EscU
MSLITLNKGKCEFNRDKVEFFGYVFSKDGISADPKKINAIKNAEPPKNAAEIRSLLGLANYVSRFMH